MGLYSIWKWSILEKIMAYLCGDRVHRNEIRYKMCSGAAGLMGGNSCVQTKGLLSTPRFLCQKTLNGVCGTAVPQMH